jgi:DNA-directed RNA polymerase subunit RPC12/RpoP
MIRVDCPACGREFDFSDFLAGLTVVCKNCSQRILVPARRQPAPPTGDAITSAPKTTRPAPANDAIAPAPNSTRPPPTAVACELPVEVPSIRNSPLDFTSATERASALLEAGETVPHIEQRLVALGLAPEVANLVVEKVLEERVRQQVEPMRRADQRNRWHRMLSAIVGCLCLLLACSLLQPWSLAKIGISVVLAVAWIWFPNAMGPYDGRNSVIGIIWGAFRRWVGWLVLIAISIHLLLLAIKGT